MNANLPRHAGGTAADPESAPTAHPPAVGEVPGSAAHPVLFGPFRWSSTQVLMFADRADTEPLATITFRDDLTFTEGARLLHERLALYLATA